MKNIYKKLLIIILTTLSGQLFFQPFNSDFRFSLGVVTLTLLILVFQEEQIFLVCVETGVFIILFRTIVELGVSNYPVEQIFLKHIPVIGFYLTFGLLLKVLLQFDLKRHPVQLIILLAITDTAANIVELIIRSSFPFSSNLMLPVVKTLLLVGCIRGLLSMVSYVLIYYNNLISLKEEQYNHYRQLLLFTANLKAEILYLQKNMIDTENAMTKGYLLYEQLTKIAESDKNPALNDLKSQLLTLTTDIHEIKKNDLRVLSGIKKLIPISKNRSELMLSEIGKMIIDNSHRLAETFAREIHFSLEIKEDLKIKQYYYLFSILNNLVINSIDAITDLGQIYIKSMIDSDKLILKVIDSGRGIDPKDLPVIFEPGFSTKFDPFTGNQSTGLGLTHVILLIEELRGHLEIKSTPNIGTTFTISLPLTAIISKEGQHE